MSFGRGTAGKGLALPCGRCIGCRLERARQWAVRIMHESKMHDANSFLTLTYDEEHLPPGGTLRVSDLQRFFKRLRARIAPQRIRFFACGEYGERLGRPHYHAIVFGWYPPDAVFLKGSGELSVFTSSLLSAAWGLGHAVVGSVTPDSATYVANYSTKKVLGPSAEAHYQGRRPEFLVMSRRPGVGQSWVRQFFGDVFPSDEVIVKGMSCRPPRYYDQELLARSPFEWYALKARRAEQAEALTELVEGTSMEVVPGRNARRLAVREKVARAKLALKRRNLESA